MASSLHNAPLPDTHVHRYDLMARDPLRRDRDEQELKARAFYFAKAAAGDASAKLMLRSHPRWRLRGWYRKGHGDVIGCHLSKVVAEKEGQRGR